MPGTVALLVTVAVVVLGGFVQGTVGFGLNLIAVPLVGLVAPASVPGAFYVVTLPMTVSMALHERETIDWPGVRALLAGRVPGTLLGLVALAALDVDTRLVAVGVVVLAGTALTAYGHDIALTTRNQVLAGIATGIMGTLAGVDGPPMALLHHRSRPEVMRPTLAVLFAIGGVLSLAVAATQGVVHPWHLLLDLALVPAAYVGQLAARRVRGRLAPAHFRVAVLVLTTVAGIAALSRGLSA